MYRSTWESLGRSLKRIMLRQVQVCSLKIMTVVLILTGMVNSRVEPFTTCGALDRTEGRELPSDSSDIMFCAVVLTTILATVATVMCHL